jgi:hypothetical protein
MLSYEYEYVCGSPPGVRYLESVWHTNSVVLAYLCSIVMGYAATIASG